MSRANERIILGIDPGTIVMGYGLIRVSERRPEMLAMGVIHLNKWDNHYDRLQRIFSRIIGIIEEYLPDEMALEAPFYGKNVQSMLKLGRAQGVAMAAALSRGIPITEYAPMKVKHSIATSGSASKEQVAAMLQKILRISEEQMPCELDATDALAVALCHYYQTSHPMSSTDKSITSWKAFVRENPDKVRRL